MTSSTRDSRAAAPSEELAGIKGIGPAAADAMVLFALKRPAYPVDRATFRVLVRHGWLDVDGRLRRGSRFCG